MRRTNRGGSTMPEAMTFRPMIAADGIHAIHTFDGLNPLGSN